MAGEPIVLHFIAAVPAGPIKTNPINGPDGTVISYGGEYCVACMPHVDGLHANRRGTGEAWLVNCPKCKQTELYERADKTPPTPQPEV